MNFVSYNFVIFLLFVVVAFRLAAPNQRKYLLLLASYIFYASFSVPFLLVLLCSTSIDFFAARIIHASTNTVKAKAALYVAAGANLAVLGVFKYFNFFLDVQATAANMLHISTPLPRHMEIIFPLGISYYTFEAISYLIDVYRGRKPANNWIDYSFYIMWFPHLISGPIVRFNELYRQYKLPLQLPSLQRIGKATELIIFGYAFKVIFADQAEVVANHLYFKPNDASVLQTYVGVEAFALQVFLDFLGYTQIARGVSLLFNIELPANFNHPFLATNIANFWQRWQITLTKWLYDYVFLPLGGSRRSILRTMLNVFLTLFIAGIWHGAGWTFVLFGAYYGVLAALYHLFRRYRRKWLGRKDRALTENRIYSIACTGLMMCCTIYGAVIFRSPDVHTINVITTRLLNIPGLLIQLAQALPAGQFTLAAQLFLFPLMGMCGPLLVKVYNETFLPLPHWLRVQFATVTVVYCWIFSCEAVKPFIYFQF